jgi:phospholipase/carboxylesterase
VACKEPAPSSTPSPTHAPASPAARAPAKTSPSGPAAPALALVEFTTGGADESQPLPLVLALHGLGDRPENFGGWLRALPAPARVDVLRAPMAYGDGFSWFEPTGRSVVDAGSLGPGVEAAARRVLSDLDALVARRPTRGRPVLTGFSQGGMISFAVAALAPERIAAALPIGGVLPTAIEPPAAPAKAPLLVAFHGADDARVPVGLARTSVERFRGRGWGAELRAYPGVGHSIGPDERRDLLQALASCLP